MHVGINAGYKRREENEFQKNKIDDLGLVVI